MSFVQVVTEQTGSSMNNITNVRISQRARFSIWSAIAVLGITGAMSSMAVHAQSQTGSLFGQAPAGETVTASSAAGLHRHATVKASGHYSIGPLPSGDYTVTLEKDGNTVDTRSNVALLASRGAEVDFPCPNDQCASH
jgi:hypothetical protein